MLEQKFHRFSITESFFPLGDKLLLPTGQLLQVYRIMFSPLTLFGKLLFFIILFRDTSSLCIDHILAKIRQCRHFSTQLHTPYTILPFIFMWNIIITIPNNPTESHTFARLVHSTDALSKILYALLLLFDVGFSFYCLLQQWRSFSLEQNSGYICRQPFIHYCGPHQVWGRTEKVHLIESSRRFSEHTQNL